MAKSDSRSHTSIYTDEETRDALKMLEKKHGVSRSEIVRRAIHQMAMDGNKIRQKVRELVKLTGA
jgi:predicted DNA-binding protein